LCMLLTIVPTEPEAIAARQWAGHTIPKREKGVFMKIESVNMNMGCVIYEKDFQSGKMNANWRFSFANKFETGTGKAIGDPGENYSGEYAITYYNSHGIESGHYDLMITELKDCYRLEWYQGEILKCFGIGMRSANLLIAGWTKLQ
jgi:hypothetical protein